MTMLIASFDIGWKSFSFCVEEVDKLCLFQAKNIGQICKIGKILLWKLFNLSITNNFDDCYYEMYKILKCYNYIWKKCSFIIIEQQRRRNIRAIKLAQHCASFFILKYNIKIVKEFPAKYKTSIFNIKFKKKYNRKKWCIKKCFYILILRQDYKNIKLLEDKKKKDDLADCFCQLQAFKILIHKLI